MKTRKNNGYLLIVLELIVQDDSVGLVRLGPGEGDAVHGAAHLVHDGHSGRSCKRGKKNTSSVLKDQSTDSQPLECVSRLPTADLMACGRSHAS